MLTCNWQPILLPDKKSAAEGDLVRNGPKSGCQHTMHPLDMPGYRCYYSDRFEVRRSPSSIQRYSMRLDHACHWHCDPTTSVVQQLVGRQRQHRVNRTLWQVNA